MSGDTTNFTSTCDLLDARPGLGCCELQFNSYGAVKRFCGPIQTVTCCEDNVVMHHLLEHEHGDGRVLVVDGHGSLANALLGDRVGARAVELGWAGVVINGSIRDVDAMAELNFGVFARGVIPRRSRKEGLGAVGVPIFFGGVTFQPGGYIWCDADGVVVDRPSTS